MGRIPRDNYAERAITWGQFKLGDATIWFFNTHLPHNHNEASSKTTHAKIANMPLEKRRELGAENEPSIVVGDMNSFASDYNKIGGGVSKVISRQMALHGRTRPWATLATEVSTISYIRQRIGTRKTAETMALEV